MHRICKAYLQGLEEIDAVQLEVMPAPRGRVLANGAETASLGEHEEKP
jgi:hypothetical protein